MDWHQINALLTFSVVLFPYSLKYWIFLLFCIGIRISKMFFALYDIRSREHIDTEWFPMFH